MKINDFALENGVSRTTAYNLIKANGYKAGQLTNSKGDLTERGLTILRGIFENRTEAANPDALEELDAVRESLRAAEAERDALQKEIDGLKGQLAEARERAEKWESLYLELQQDAKQEREKSAERERETRVLLAQQMEINRYLSMNPVKRLFSGRNRKPVETAGTVE